MKHLILSSLILTTLSCAAADKEKEVASAKPVPAKKKKFKKNYRTAYNHKKGYVISPFKPYNVLDVKHLKPGMLAYDPYTARYDAKTKKRDYSKAKIFRVPHPKDTSKKKK